MQSMRIILSDEEVTALDRAAKRDVRDLRSQARFAIRDYLLRMGFLDTEILRPEKYTQEEE